MDYKRILTIQDISCVGQCSLTVALPVISACGVECSVLPSAVLSTHTAGFKGYTFRDLTEDMPAINDHWSKENIKFDAVYTGYLGSTKQIDYVKAIMNSALKDGAKTVVDPAMADGGKLYYGFDDDYYWNQPYEGYDEYYSDYDEYGPYVEDQYVISLEDISEYQ